MKKHRGEGAPAGYVQCPRCGKVWKFGKILSDAPDCPACRKGDKESDRARFAPAKRGPLGSEPEVAEDSPIVTHQS